jgi:hypothetical protein
MIIPKRNDLRRRIDWLIVGNLQGSILQNLASTCPGAATNPSLRAFVCGVGLALMLGTRRSFQTGAPARSAWDDEPKSCTIIVQQGAFISDSQNHDSRVGPLLERDWDA